MAQLGTQPVLGPVERLEEVGTLFFLLASILDTGNPSQKRNGERSGTNWGT